MSRKARLSSVEMGLNIEPYGNKQEKQDKQESLKQVLKETMDLTMTLKEQLKILKRKGIHNKATQPKKLTQKHT